MRSQGEKKAGENKYSPATGLAWVLRLTLYKGLWVPPLTYLIVTETPRAAASTALSALPSVQPQPANMVQQAQVSIPHCYQLRKALLCSSTFVCELPSEEEDLRFFLKHSKLKKKVFISVKIRSLLWDE